MIDSNPKWSPDGLKIVFTANSFLNESEVNGSDIAVIKLTHEFTVNTEKEEVH
jgi:Tol biopolymer transport system component